MFVLMDSVNETNSLHNQPLGFCFRIGAGLYVGFKLGIRAISVQ